MEITAKALEEARCPEDIFEGIADERALAEAYRRLALLFHPDRSGSDEAFRRLHFWREQARKSLAAGTWGERRAPFDPVTLTVEGEPLTLTGLRGQGFLSTVYDAEFAKTPTGFRAVARIVSAPADNDLLEREWDALTEIRRKDSDSVAEREFFAKQRAYVPWPLARFFVTDAERRRRLGLVLAVPEGRCFSAQALREQKFPRGLEPRHVWWIWRRLLLTLWMAHLRGRVHGAVTPDHLLIYPEQHGLVLLDWCASARIGVEPVPLADPAWAALEPPELREKPPASVPGDLFRAASVALYLLGDEEKNVAEPLRRFIARCREVRPGRRPQDAEHAHAMLGRLLGKREFAEMIVD